MTIEDLVKCSRCGAEAQIHLYPSDKYVDGISYIVDCINANDPRPAVTRPQYRTREEAAHGWNEEQRSE